MPTIEDRLRDAGRVWRDHVDAARPADIPQPTAPHGRRRTRRMVLAAAAAAACVGVGIPVAGVLAHRAADHHATRGGVAASCAGPRLRLDEQPRSGGFSTVRGQSLIVTGRFYLDRCNDTNAQLGPAPRPLTLTLILRHGSHVVHLRTVRAHGELGTFRTTVRIPADFPAGRATLTSDVPPVGPVRLTVN